MNEEILEFISQNGEAAQIQGPQITLSYAQSIDGSLSLERGRATPISGPESLHLTHQLRAIHEGILVGIGTVLADDPQLSVRELEGKNPRPLIIDSQLRMPLEAKLLKQEQAPWIFCVEHHEAEKRKRLEDLGVSIFPLASTQDGRVDLERFFGKLGKLSMGKIMLEGGAALISSFLSAKLVRKVVITIAPLFIGGLNVIDTPILKNGLAKLPRINAPQFTQIGNDVILWGEMNKA